MNMLARPSDSTREYANGSSREYNSINNNHSNNMNIHSNGNGNGTRDPMARGDRRTAAAWPPPGRARDAEELVVDAIFSAHSDGLMVILRPSNASRGTAREAAAGLGRTSPNTARSPSVAYSSNSSTRARDSPSAMARELQGMTCGSPGRAREAGNAMTMTTRDRDSLTLPPIRDQRPSSTSTSSSAYARPASSSSSASSSAYTR